MLNLTRAQTESSTSTSTPCPTISSSCCGTLSPARLTSRRSRVVRQGGIRQMAVRAIPRGRGHMKEHAGGPDRARDGRLLERRGEGTGGPHVTHVL